MALERDVRYVESGGLQIAYEVIGDGPIDIVLAWDTGTHLDIMWEHPLIEQFVRRLGEIGRVINVDPRGVGLSDPMERVPTLEEWTDDVQAVLRAAGSTRAALIGQGNGAQLFMLFAAMHPNQTAALVTINGYARLRRAADYPCGFPPEAEELTYEILRQQWGTGRALAHINPSYSTSSRNIAWLARLERASATPARALRRQRFAFDVDVRDVLPAIHAPTLVASSQRSNYVRPEHGQYLIDHIAGSRLLALPGTDHVPLGTADEMELLAGGIEQFLTGAAPRPATQRSLMSVAFTDIVDSTVRAAEVGDKRWRSMLEVHESIARQHIDAVDGRVVKFTGDGLLATFDGPARAVQCMKAMGESLDSFGLPIRAGVHTGEVESIGDDIGGLAVHIAARISALARAGEILTSSTVRDLVAGSGLEFEDRGEQELKGVPGAWRVLAVR